MLFYTITTEISRMPARKDATFGWVRIEQVSYGSPTRLSIGILNPRSRLSMPIGSSYRLFGVTFSDGSRARLWTLSMGPLMATGEVTEFYFEGSRLNERKEECRGVDYGDESSVPIGDICRTG